MFLSRELEDVKLLVVLQWHDIMWQVVGCFLLRHIKQDYSFFFLFGKSRFQFYKLDNDVL